MSASSYQATTDDVQLVKTIADSIVNRAIANEHPPALAIGIAVAVLTRVIWRSAKPEAYEEVIGVVAANLSEALAEFAIAKTKGRT